MTLGSLLVTRAHPVSDLIKLEVYLQIFTKSVIKLYNLNIINKTQVKTMEIIINIGVMHKS